MITRLSKSLCVCAIALFISLAVFNNLTDYATNFIFIQHVLSMDSIFPNATVDYRAINATLFHHVAYIMIIIIETICALICWYGGITLLKNCKKVPLNLIVVKNGLLQGLPLHFCCGMWLLYLLVVSGLRCGCQKSGIVFKLLFAFISPPCWY